MPEKKLQTQTTVSSRSANSKDTQNTRQKIIDNAIDLFSKKGYHESSMRDIAKAVGIKASSLYSHFKSKREILISIFELYRNNIISMRISDDVIEQIAKQHTPEQIFIEGFKAIGKGVSGPQTQKILHLLYNEMFRNPEAGEFALDWLKIENTRELTKIFEAMKRHSSLRDIEATSIAALYNSIINSHFQQRCTLEACGRKTDRLERETIGVLKQFASLLIK